MNETAERLRHLVAEVRAKHPQTVQDGACLACGDEPHVGRCNARDFWGGRCGCAERTIRGQQEARRAS